MIVRPIMEIYPWAWVFFVPFIIITSFAVLNLFIGIIVDSMQTLKDDDTVEKQIESKDQVNIEMQRLNEKLDRILNQYE